MADGWRIKQPSGAEIIVVAKKDADFEAIGIADVENRIRAEFPTLDPKTLESVAGAVVALLPTPPEMAEALTKAISSVESLYKFVDGSRPTDETVVHWSDLRRDLFTVGGTFQMLRDRMHRVCEHSDLRDTDDGGKMCPTCGSGWSELSGKPGRMFSSRSYFLAAKGQKSPGRGVFVYFLTSLLVHLEKVPRVKALKMAGRLLWLFWNDGKPVPASDLKLDGLCTEGRRTAKKGNFITPEDFVNWVVHANRIEPGMIIWVPVRRPQTVEEGGGDS